MEVTQKWLIATPNICAYSEGHYATYFQLPYEDSKICGIGWMGKVAFFPNGRGFRLDCIEKS